MRPFSPFLFLASLVGVAISLCLNFELSRIYGFSFQVDLEFELELTFRICMAILMDFLIVIIQLVFLLFIDHRSSLLKDSQALKF